MSKKRKILVGVILGGLAVAGILFFFYFDRSADLITKQNQIRESVLKEDEADSEEAWEGYPATEEGLLQPSVYLEVTQADCTGDCQAFSGSSEKLAYCRAYCGLSQVEGEAPAPVGSCEERKGIERDRCIKDEAVREKSIERCADMYDENLKKSCQARVTEDYFP